MRIVMILVLVVSLLGCKSTLPMVQEDWQASITALRTYQAQFPFPQDLQSGTRKHDAEELDVMHYFTILTRLRMRAGYTLDWVYHFDGMGGYPVLYARPTDQAPFDTEAELLAQIERDPSQDPRDYNNYLEVEDSPAGFFQLMVLQRVGPQFFLFWHAAYNDTRVITNREALNQVLDKEYFGSRLPTTVQLRAKLLKTEPVIRMEKDRVTLELLVFTAWGGFHKDVWVFERNAPYNIISREAETLVPYEVGVMF
ncbi:MAG: hypothetical protein GXY52_08915 [Chloroflexi bacterium]|nr:hypothetical protein [Chloroflexota bacterium]